MDAISLLIMVMLFTIPLSGSVLALVLYFMWYKHTAILDYGGHFKVKKVKEVKMRGGTVVGYSWFNWFRKARLLPVIPPAGRKGRGAVFEYFIPASGEAVPMIREREKIDLKQLKENIKARRFNIPTKTVKETIQYLEAIPEDRKIRTNVIEMASEDALARVELIHGIRAQEQIYTGEFSHKKIMLMIVGICLGLGLFVGFTFYTISQGMESFAKEAKPIAELNEKSADHMLDIMEILERNGMLQPAQEPPPG